MPNTYQIDEKSGLLQENIFFAIDSPFEGFVSSIEDDWIIGGTRHQDGFDYQVDSASARAITVKWRETGKCSFTACCTRQKVLEKLVMEYVGGEKSEFVISDSSQLIVFSEMKNALNQFRGLDFLQVIHTDNHSRLPELWCLHRHSSPSPLRRHQIVPARANQCPTCKLAPLVCPGCNRLRSPCPKCNRADFFVPEKHHAGARDDRIITRPYPKRMIVEVEKWNGDDIFGDGVTTFATKRLVDHLLSTHVGPFIAEPALANVKGIDEAKRLLVNRAIAPN